MKLTNKQLRQIIKEELENVLNEATKYTAEFSDEGVEVKLGMKTIMYVTKGQHEYYKPLAGALTGNRQAKMELAKQVSQKVGSQVSPNDIEVRAAQKDPNAGLDSAMDYRSRGKY